MMTGDKLIVDTDLEVSIDTLYQAKTYGGLLEGVPTKRLNDQIIERVKNKAREMAHGIMPVTIIEPKTRKILGLENNVFGKSIALPGVYCIAEIISSQTFKDPSKDGSGLMVIWFQDTFAWPIQEDVLQELQKLPYKQLCGEFEY